ncbi:unnamed protein product, partial [Ectocarpus fasciculatus]
RRARFKRQERNAALSSRADLVAPEDQCFREPPCVATSAENPSSPVSKLTDRAVYSAITEDGVGLQLKYRAMTRGAEAAEWLAKGSEEWDRLIEGTSTLHFVSADTKPKNQKAAYVKHVCTEKIKPPGLVPVKRVRTTIGGDKIDYSGETAAYTAGLKTVKLLWNSVVSTPRAKFMTIDVKNFYLHTRLKTPEYAWVQLSQIPEATQLKYGVASLAKEGKVLVEITGGMYGLPQAGLLAQRDLVKHLAAHGYHMTKTSCLFRHESRDVTFSLIVDDFGVKYTNRADVEHLITTLSSVYEVHVDWTGDRFLGITLDWDYHARSVRTSLPDFVPKALVRYRYNQSHRKVHSPGAFVRPQYGATQQLVPVDTSAPLSPRDVILLQSIIGTFLWYCRVLDFTGLVALGQLAQALAHPTENTLVAAHHLLQYFATYPSASVTYRASGMILRIHSDASYLSEPNAGSRLGALEYLGSEGDQDEPPSNGLVNVISCRSDVVTSSACESEWAAIFKACKEAQESRQTLSDLGFPQQATIVTSDNKCAVGLCNGTVKPKRSKAMDMRFHWVTDRVRQGQFIIRWAPGDTNYADYFTKLHPAKHHQLMREFFIQDIISVSAT